MGEAYKSMSWSTSSRERAKLGRLDSEPPLLLREWPPETGQRDKGEGRGGRQVQAKEGGRKSTGVGVRTGNQSSRRGRETATQKERIGLFSATTVHKSSSLINVALVLVE